MEMQNQFELCELSPARYWPIHKSMFISVESMEITRESLPTSDRSRGKFIQVSWGGHQNFFHFIHLLCPGNLGTVFNFKNTITEAIADEETSNIYFCGGDVNPINMSQATTACSFLIGSYLILFDDASCDEVISAFEPVSQWFLNSPEKMDDEEYADDHITVFDCWRALTIAKLNS